VEQHPPVLVSQGQGLHPVHEGAGCVSACSCAGRFEGCGADRGARGEKAILLNNDQDQTIVITFMGSLALYSKLSPLTSTIPE
jgi:hypothetical protein